MTHKIMSSKRGAHSYECTIMKKNPNSEFNKNRHIVHKPGMIYICALYFDTFLKHYILYFQHVVPYFFELLLLF